MIFANGTVNKTYLNKLFIAHKHVLNVMIGKLALNAIYWLYNKARIINPKKLYTTHNTLVATIHS